MAQSVPLKEGLFACTIVIPTYGRPARLKNAVMSCLNEKEIACEIVVVDDGSPNAVSESLAGMLGASEINGISSTNAWEARFGIHRICLLRQENRGAPAARNLGLCAAIGQYVKFLDDDDELVPGSLAEEIFHARKSGADVVVTGWINRIFDHENCGGNFTDAMVPAPDLSAGIDAMLVGRAPWTSAALYRLTAVSQLRWDESCEKAQEWMWAWTVALSGASFVNLDIASAIYSHYPSNGRVSTRGDAVRRSAQWRQYVLTQVQSKLAEAGLLNQVRRRALVQYYFKDARFLCEFDRLAWSDLCRRCQDLAKDFKPKDGNVALNWLVSILGMEHGVTVFVRCKNLIRHLIRRKNETPARARSQP